MTEQDDFEVWLMNIDDELHHFFENIPADLKFKLDNSIDSLIDIEDYILSSFKCIEDLMSNKIMHNQIAIYIGETFRKNLTGKWNLRIEDPKFAFYGLPIIIQPNKKSAYFCPLTLATTVIDRQKGDFLQQLLTNQIK